MSLALPTNGIAIAAPLGAAGLFATWYAVGPRRAFLLGFVAGVVYFARAFAWFGETAGALVAPFGALLVLAPAAIEALAFALAATLASLAVRRLPAPVAPLVAAAAFAACEWLRCSGPLAAPFACLGYTQLDGPLAALGAYLGVFGVTFATALAGASLAALARARPHRATRQGVVRGVGATFAGLLLAALAADRFWPAHAAAPADLVVAAAQGNVAQSLKWSPAALAEAERRYAELTRLATASVPKPAFVLWPETVMTVDLDRDPALRARLSALARETGAALVVGAKRAPGDAEYNALFVIEADGREGMTYDKRELVPFVERLPAEALLSHVPGADLVSNFGRGTGPPVVRVGGVPTGPLICWESTFSEHATADVRAGARVLLVATDDAWFGMTAGPAAHAAIARMDAIETGAWVVRAAATGISGIIAPDGRWTARAELGTYAAIRGRVGPPARTLYDALGPAPVGIAFAAIGVAPLLRRRRNAR